MRCNLQFLLCVNEMGKKTLTITASPTDPAVKKSNGISSLCAVSQLITWVNIPPINHDLFLVNGCCYTNKNANRPICFYDQLY